MNIEKSMVGKTVTMDYDEICLTCHYPRGSHVTEHLIWIVTDGGQREVNYWQDGICPYLHNMTQPPWDLYLFRGETDRVRSNRPEWSRRY